jgi:dipeptidyl aminopeptidase/acylaminoacyl peptidase
MTLTFHRFLLCATWLLLAASPSVQAAEPVPLADFFNNPAFSGASLSPDGRYLALTAGDKGKRDRLGILTLADMSLKVVAQYGDADIGKVEWVNGERLVFNVRDRQSAPGDWVFGPGLYAINADGGELRQLALRRGVASTTGSRIDKKVLPWNTYLLGQRGAQDSSFIYVLSPAFDHLNQVREMNLLRLDTLTGRSESVSHPHNTRSWLLDHKGEPRLVVAVDKDIETIHYRDPANGDWRVVAQFDTYKGGRGSFQPLSFGPDGTLYVSTNADLADTLSLHAFNPVNGQLNKTPLLSLKDFDFSGDVVTSKEKLLGVHFTNDASSTIWYDPAMKAMQAKVDALLPSTSNRLSVPPRAATPWVLVRSHSDVQPLVYRLYNSATNDFVKVGGTQEQIDPARMANQDLVRYQARDGLTIPAWLTLPKGKQKNLPMVVLVHGGPYVRGNVWGWHADAQFLASRGYAVLEPEFRGSKGYGSKHFRSGWKQWGLAMQNDIADGTRWAIAQGIANGKRICIAGASYGGYATLMGLVNDPELYQCGINWVGVTDIDLLSRWSAESDLSSNWQDYGMPDLIGDVVKDAEQLKATSPIQQAARITKPLLMAYGSADKRVPLVHGKKFYDAVKATNKEVELVVYPDEGHGWSLPQTRVDFWGRVERFLDQHIGKP